YKTVNVSRIGSRMLLALGAVTAFAFAGYEIYQMTKSKPGVTYTEIPARIVTRTYDAEEVNYMTYSVARAVDDKKADLHNWKGTEWVAVYTTSDVNAGEPVLAASLRIEESAAVSDAELIPVTEFCYKNSFNLLEQDDPEYYLFFKTGIEAVEEDSINAEGSVFGYPSMALTIFLLVLVIGAGFGIYIKKRKKTE
nr:hypothetical protein [Lachnospiraceae bacterium]